MSLKISNIHSKLISRYLNKNLVLIFLAILLIFSLIIFGNQFVSIAQKAVKHGIPLPELMPLMGFNMIRDLPIILSLSFFLSVVISISQLYKNSEAIAMNSFGIGEKNFINFIKPLVILIFIIIFMLSMYIVPWAKYQKSVTEDITVNASEFTFISEGKFESFQNGKIVFYASESSLDDNEGEQNMEEIFIHLSNESTPTVVLASEATKYKDSKSESIYLRLRDGVRYEGLPGNGNVNILDFDSYDLEIVSGEVQKSISNFTKIESRSSIDLLLEGGVLSHAEIQWRLSQPISIMILSFIGVLLGRASPRTGKGVNLLFGIIIFMLYYNILLVAKNSVESGQLNPFIGLWSIHIMIILFMIIFYQFRQGKFSSFIAKISAL